MNTIPPDRCPAWGKLSTHATRLSSVPLAGLLRDTRRGESLRVSAPGLTLDYARQHIDQAALETLLELARQRDLERWRTALLDGSPINTTESRAAWHTALRAGATAPPEVRSALALMRREAEALRIGSRLGATSKPLTRLVHLGTGGSDLGPRLLVDALFEHCDERLAFRFVSNIDPLDLDRALRDADPETTLFVVVSKAFTTQETIENALAARAWLAHGLPAGAPLDRHFIAVTAHEKEAHRFGVSTVLPIWDWVGGRYSLWSAVGFTAMCAFGPALFDELLMGAGEMDRHFAETPLERNLPVLMGLLSVWNVNFLGASTQVVLPYSTALRLLPAHLQQLEMESNGKSVDRNGDAIGYASAPVVWGAEGTVAQHSFHQLLHQGTHLVPADFIVIEEAPGDSRRRAILATHAEAQATALALGRTEDSLPAHRRYTGNRPSSTLTMQHLDARNMGRMLAAHEHKVFVQGAIWNVNSFDQWGVEFGKELAARLHSKP